MRISDWSSDVCSSDLRLGISPVVIGFTIAVTGSSALDLRLGSTLRFRVMASLAGGDFAGANTVSILLILRLSAVIWPLGVRRQSIGRATCRCRVCPAL